MSVCPILVIISRLLPARPRNILNPFSVSFKMSYHRMNTAENFCRNQTNVSTMGAINYQIPQPFETPCIIPFEFPILKIPISNLEKLKPTYCSYICLFCFRLWQERPMIHCGLPILSYQICHMQSNNA